MRFPFLDIKRTSLKHKNSSELFKTDQTILTYHFISRVFIHHLKPEAFLSQQLTREQILQKFVSNWEKTLNKIPVRNSENNAYYHLVLDKLQLKSITKCDIQQAASPELPLSYKGLPYVALP